jgi:hypothetical protein
MIEERNLLSQQDVVDNLTSTSTIYPLSANQGRVLQNEINNISGGGIVKADFSSNYNGLIYDMPFGSLDWEASSNQLKVSFDDNINSLEYITVSSSVKNRDINSNKQFLEVSGVINISASTSYYFSDDGLLNSSLNMDNEGDTTYLTVGFSTNSPNLTSYSLNLSIQRQQSGLDTIMINGLFLTNEISTATFIGFSIEANGYPGNQQPIFSWGGRENPSDVGEVIPFPVAFTQMSFTNANNLFDPLASPIELVKNGIPTGSIATFPAGSQRAVVNINPSVGFAAGDRLSFKRSGGSGASSIALNSIIIGRILL